MNYDYPAMEKLKRTNAWKELEYLAPLVKRKHMRDMFELDPTRSKRYSVEGAGLFLDFSKNRVTDQVMSLLIELAEERGLVEKTKAMFAGKTINNTEQRAALHTAFHRAFSWLGKSETDNPVFFCTFEFGSGGSTAVG